MSEPIGDVFNFLVGDTSDYGHLGPAKYLSVIFYLVLLVAGLIVAGRNWQDDPAQRTGRNVIVLAMRILAGAMWFQGTIWKLPLPVSGGFSYWLVQEGRYGAIPLYSALIRDVLVPNIALLQTPVYLLEIFFTVTLTLGFAVRLSGVVAALFTLQLWFGLYNDPTEWPWTYIAIVIAHAMFAVDEAGRRLGLDSLLRMRDAALVRGNGIVATAYRLAS